MNKESGLGNICPWRNSSLRLRMTILNNGKVIYSSFNQNEEISKIISDLKRIKERIKKIPNHLKIINFLVDKNIKEESITTDLINLNFKLLPKELFENIITMRCLELREISFQDLNYLKINEFEVFNLMGEITVLINIFDFVDVPILYFPRMTVSLY